MYHGRVCMGRVVGRSGKGYESVRCVRVHLYRCDESVVTPFFIWQLLAKGSVSFERSEFGPNSELVPLCNRC